MALTPDTIQRIMMRDGFRCVYCGYDAGASLDAWRHGRLCIDHLKSRKLRGGDEDENLVTACAACNSDKAHNPFDSIDEVRRWLRLYRKECSEPWFQTYVLGRKANPSSWNAPQRLRRVRQRFDAGEDEPA
jgi:hypothetical protein